MSAVSATFVQHVELVARRIQRRRWMVAICWSFAAIVAVVIGLMLVDWQFNVQATAARVVLSLLLAVAIIAIGRRAWRATRERTTPLDVALELQRRLPGCGDLLASGLQFSQQAGDDPTAGSLDLRRAVVVRASLAAEEVDFEAIVPHRPLRRAALAAALAAFVLSDLAALPQFLGTGATRLLNPLSDAEWPRRHDLAFEGAPRVVPIGGDFVTTLRDRRGALPPSVEIQFRTRQHGRAHYETQTIAGRGDAVEIRRPNVQEAFEYRAVGGDHRSMPWRSVGAALAPQITSLHVSVEPPPYAGLPAVAASEPVEVVAGSAIQIRGALNRPVDSARLEATGQQPVTLQIDAERRSFRAPTAPWRPSQSAVWSFAVVTPAGMSAVADRRLSIEVAPDRPPSVEFIEPVDELAVRPEATIALVVEARDDLAVRAIDLEVVGDSREAPSQPAANVELFRAVDPTRGPQRVDYSLDLSTIDPPPNSTWQVFAIAGDFAKQDARTPSPLRLRIITDDEFLRRLDALQSRLVAAVESARFRQQQTRDRVQGWIAADGQPAAAAAASSLMQQRAVRVSIAAGPDSARRLAELAVQEISRNAWPDERARAKSGGAVAALVHIAEEQLPPLENQLAALVRQWQQPAGNGASPLGADGSQKLTEVLAMQDQVLAALDKLLQSSAQVDLPRQFERELAALKSQQAAELERTEALAVQQFQRSPGEGVDAGREVQAAAARQAELAAGLSGVLNRMRLSATSPDFGASEDAARLQAAVAFAERQRLLPEAQAAADDLAAERAAQAAAVQRRIIAQLQQLLMQLAGGDVQSTVDRLADLEDAERRLRVLRDEVQALAARQQAGDAQNGVAALDQTRRDIAARARDLSRHVAQLGAPAASTALDRAGDALAGSDDSAPSYDQADRDLADAADQLAVVRRGQHSRLLRLAIERLDGALQKLVAAQQGVVADVRQLHQLDGKSIAANELPTRAAVARRQAAVGAESTAEADRLTSFPVFAGILRSAADAMHSAELRLGGESADELAVRDAQRALDLLRRLAQVVHHQRQQQGETTGAQPPAAPENGRRPQLDPDQALALQLAVAQLHLVRTMQVELLDATREVEQRLAAHEDDQPLRDEASRLAAEQRELADLAAKLLVDPALSKPQESPARTHDEMPLRPSENTP